MKYQIEMKITEAPVDHMGVNHLYEGEGKQRTLTELQPRSFDYFDDGGKTLVTLWYRAD